MSWSLLLTSSSSSPHNLGRCVALRALLLVVAAATTAAVAAVRDTADADASAPPSPPPLPPRFASAASVVTLRPPDARATDANDARFGLVGDGVHDDTAALQAALFEPYLAPGAPDCTLPGARVVLLRGDGARYRVSATLRLPIWARLVGHGNLTRPAIVLAPATPGFGAAALVKAVLQVVDWTPDPNPDRRPSGGQCNVSAEIGGDTAFGTGLINVDIEVGAGNPAAVAVSNGAAQGGVLRNMHFALAPDALAAIFTPGWAHEALVVEGGRYAVLLFYTTWPSTFRDCAFRGQAAAAFAWQAPAVSPWEGVVVLRSWFAGMPAAIDATGAIFDSARATLIDCVFRSVGAVALLPTPTTAEGRASLLLERCVGDATPLLVGAVPGAINASTAPAGGPNGAFSVAHLVVGAVTDHARGCSASGGSGGSGPATSCNISLLVRLEVQGLVALPNGLAPDAEPPPPETPPMPPSERWTSVLDEGLVGDGVFDNAPALKDLLGRAAVQPGGAFIFFPTGIYAFRSTIELPAPAFGPLHLFGLSCWDAVLTLADGVFTDPADPRPFLRALGGGSAHPTWVSGLNVRTGFTFGVPQPPPVPAGYLSPNPGAIALLFEAASGGVQDVFFHPNTFPDNGREGNSPNDELSLVVANGGAGVFADIWSCNAYSSGGARVYNTTGPVVFSQLSSEHHFGHELWVTNATGVVVHGMQTEDRSDSSPTSSVLLEAGSSAHVVALFSYYTAGEESPAAVRVDDSSVALVEIFRQYHSYHPVEYACSVLVESAASGAACVNATDFASVNATMLVTGPASAAAAPAAAASVSRVAAPAAPAPASPAAAPAAHAAAFPPPRLPNSPFPLPRRAPASVTVVNVTGASFDKRVLFLSLSGVVAQGAPEIFVLDEADVGGAGPTGRGAGGPTGGMSRFQLDLLPASLPVDWALANDAIAVLRRFAPVVGGYIFCETPPPSAADNGSMHVALSLAGILGGPAVTAETLPLVLAAGLAQLLDARTLSLGDAYSLYETNFSRTVLLNQQARNLVGTIDYAVFSGALAFYDDELTSPFAAAALARMAPVSAVLGWGNELDTVTAVSRFGHFVVCSDAVANLPLFSSFAPPALPAAERSPSLPACTADPAKHTVAFGFTDGDSLTFDLGQFANPSLDWWGSPLRGSVPVAWTFQPMLQELHPLYLAHVLATATANDSFIAGPSGAGYAYMDQMNASARAAFSGWTRANMARVPKMLPIENQIQVGIFNASTEAEVVAAPNAPLAIFVDEYLQLTLRGRALLLNGTVVSSRRHCLASWGDVTPESVVQLLDASSTNSSSDAGFSLIVAEVWSYGLSAFVNISRAVDSSVVQIVSIDEYLSCLRERVFGLGDI